MTKVIAVSPDRSGFAEDKDSARQLRINQILPALDSGDSVVLDFSNVGHATQSYVHALIGEALKKHGVSVLDRIEFRKCSPALKGVVELVVDYSLGGFSDSTASPSLKPTSETAPKKQPTSRGGN